MGLTGAVVYAGNNSRRKAITLRKNNQVVAYESHDERWNRITHGVRGRKDRVLYSMDPVNGGPAFDVVGIPSKQIHRSPTAVYAVNALDTPIAGQSLTSEDRYDAQGNHIMQKDSTAEFQRAAAGLMRAYPGTRTFAFSNVHDDEADTGNVAESLDNFMEQMRLIPGNLDFFSYCGHGAEHQLPSAGLKMGRVVKRRGEKHWEESDAFSEFIDILRRSVKPGGNIIFYACSTGVVNGFAQGVSSKIPSLKVFGHTCAGQAKANPFKARIQAGAHETYASLLGDQFPAWKSYLKSGNDLWARYWNMTVNEIKAEISGKKRQAA